MSSIVATPSLSFQEAMSEFVKKIFQFNGRSRRSEYWWVQLVVIMLTLALSPVADFSYLLMLITLPLEWRRLHDIGRSGWWEGVFLILFAIMLATMGWDQFVYGDELEKLDNADESTLLGLVGKYLLWLVVIVVYSIILLVFSLLDSQPNANEYGESPKYKTIE